MIVLVNPYGSHGIFGAGQPLVAVEPNLWSRFTFGHARLSGADCYAIDAERDRLSADDVARRIEELDPDLVAITAFGHQPSATTQTMPGVREVATAIKRLNPDRPIIVTGGHVTSLPERTLREEPVDYVAIGEGPRTVVALHDHLTSRKGGLTSVPGLCWIDGGGTIVSNPPAAPLNMDVDLADGAWDAFDPRGYVAHNWHCLDGSPRTPYASIYTTLNCPFACSFCCISAPFGGSGYKTRDPRRVVDEIELLYRDYGVRNLKIADEMFVLKPSHYLPIVADIARRGMGDDLNIWCYGRTDSVKKEHLPLLRAAGIRWLALGIESGSARVRAGANKALRHDDGANAAIRRTVREIQAAGIHVIGNYIVGLPDDDLESMEETYRLACDLNTEFMNVYSAMAYPGSALYDRAIAEGWTLPETWAGYSQHNRHSRPLDTRHVPAAEVLRFRDDFFRRYFARPEYLDMVRGKFGDGAVAKIQKMTTYTLERDLLK